MDENNKTDGALTADSFKNLKPLPKSTEGLTEDEKQRVHDIRVKGGKARGEQRRLHKSLKDIANDLLDTSVSKERAMEVLGKFADNIPAEQLTNGVLLMAKMLNESLTNGTVKSAEFIRDTSGQKPKDEIALTADIMTEADRTLMANMAEILGVKPKE